MQGEAEDAGGLTPTKDDNEAMRKSCLNTNAIFWLGGVLVFVELMIVDAAVQHQDIATVAIVANHSPPKHA